jgi:hypothetical protein
VPPGRAALHASGTYLVFDDLTAYREEKTTYSREVDANGNPTERIADKEQFHLMDAERYVASHLRRALDRLANPPPPLLARPVRRLALTPTFNPRP